MESGLLFKRRGRLVDAIRAAHALLQQASTTGLHLPDKTDKDFIQELFSQVGEAEKTTNKSKPKVSGNPAKQNDNKTGDNGSGEDEAGSISLSQVQRLSRIGLALESQTQSQSRLDTASITAAVSDFYVHRLLLGASPQPYLSPSEARLQALRANTQAQSPDVRAHLEALKRKQARRELEEAAALAGGSRGVGRGLVASAAQSIKELQVQLGVGMNLLVLMATGFVVCYWLGSKLFGGDGAGLGWLLGDQAELPPGRRTRPGINRELVPVLCGLAGLVGVMLVEMCLFIIREQRRIARLESRERDERGTGRKPLDGRGGQHRDHVMLHQQQQQHEKKQQQQRSSQKPTNTAVSGAGAGEAIGGSSNSNATAAAADDFDFARIVFGVGNNNNSSAKAETNLKSQSQSVRSAAVVTDDSD